MKPQTQTAAFAATLKGTELVEFQVLMAIWDKQFKQASKAETDEQMREIILRYDPIELQPNYRALTKKFKTYCENDIFQKRDNQALEETKKLLIKAEKAIGKINPKHSIEMKSALMDAKRACGENFILRNSETNKWKPDVFLESLIEKELNTLKRLIDLLGDGLRRHYMGSVDSHLEMDCFLENDAELREMNEKLNQHLNEQEVHINNETKYLSIKNYLNKKYEN